MVPINKYKELEGKYGELQRDICEMINVNKELQEMRSKYKTLQKTYGPQLPQLISAGEKNLSERFEAP
ncbi:399_t:CDS:2 [Dentiscutata erythropus]|uniref:399_t:CDS:1 n=1 Tax=Dentiscutata erythropus TaxID=1348616 RepID=A0A9N9CJT3_9GLOM|nr:399_t:CDS:2 [Dentiscutata erythropus]